MLFHIWSSITLLAFMSDSSARQKEKALGSIMEVVQTVKHPRSQIRSVSASEVDKREVQGKLELDYLLPKSAVSTPGRQTPQKDSKSEPSSRDGGKSSRKSARLSSLG